MSRLLTASRTCILWAACLAAPAAVAAADPAEAIPPDGRVETLVVFDSQAREHPESIAVDSAGNVYLSMAPTGEIRKVAPDSSQSALAHLPLSGPTCDNGTPALMGGLAFDEHDNLYVNVNSCDESRRGIWRVTPAGESSRMVPFAFGGMINGLTVAGNSLYATDSVLGVVWTAPLSGGEPSVWWDDPRLKPAAPPPIPGANGIQFFDGELYVNNSSTRQVLAVTIADDGRPGAVREHATTEFGGDDFAIDDEGRLWMTTNPTHRVLRVEPDGSSEVVLDASDRLDGPTAAAFGRTDDDRNSLYVANAAFPIYSETHRPSLMRLDVSTMEASD